MPYPNTPIVEPVDFGGVVNPSVFGRVSHGGGMKRQPEILQGNNIEVIIFVGCVVGGGGGGGNIGITWGCI